MIVKIRSRALQRLVGLVADRASASMRRDDAPLPAAASRGARVQGNLVGQDFGPSRPFAVEERAARFDPPRRWPRRLAIAGLAATALLAVAVRGTGYRYGSLPLGPGAQAASPPPSGGVPGGDAKALAALTRENRKLRNEMDRRSPSGIYIVVDRANNRLYLKRDDEVLLEAVCSSGSGMVLREPSGDRRWVFDTPSGLFRVLSKTENPVWRKPDWAFIEEGLPVPKDPGERIEYGMLGEYGLYFGDGYLIHGTLYERLLGRSVTHGCVRLGRDDLRQVYRAAAIGTPIYIF